MWSLHPASANAPAVTLILGWLPRGGRHSALFPGERADDARPETRVIGGAPRAGIVEQAGRSFLVDFDLGALAVSVRAYTLDDARPIVDAIVASLAFDPSVRPPSR